MCVCVCVDHSGPAPQRGPAGLQGDTDPHQQAEGLRLHSGESENRTFLSTSELFEFDSVQMKPPRVAEGPGSGKVSNELHGAGPESAQESCGEETLLPSKRRRREKAVFTFEMRIWNWH